MVLRLRIRVADEGIALLKVLQYPIIGLLKRPTLIALEDHVLRLSGTGDTQILISRTGVIRATEGLSQHIDTVGTDHKCLALTLSHFSRLVGSQPLQLLKPLQSLIGYGYALIHIIPVSRRGVLIRRGYVLLEGIDLAIGGRIGPGSDTLVCGIVRPNLVHQDI